MPKKRVQIGLEQFVASLDKRQQIDEFMTLVPQIIAIFKALKDFNAEELKGIRTFIEKSKQELESTVLAKIPKKGVDYFDGKDGRNGKDGARGEPGRDGVNGRDGKDGTDGKDGKSANEQQIASQLETTLRLACEEMIKDMMAKMPKPAIGGGVTNQRIQQAFKYILKTEQPVGAIDGANTEYTVSQPIFAVLAFSLNGEVVAQLPNYTIAGNKVTFSSALSSDYAGKDFEIKYV